MKLVTSKIVKKVCKNRPTNNLINFFVVAKNFKRYFIFIRLIIYKNLEKIFASYNYN